MDNLITHSPGQDYDYQYEIISRIEGDGGDPDDVETWDEYAAEVAEDENQCATCGGSGWIVLSEYPTPAGEHTEARCIDCGGNFS